MKEFFKRIWSQMVTVWGKWSAIQKLIFSGVIVFALVTVVFFVRFSSGPQAVELLSRSITNQQDLDAIAARLDVEQVNYSITSDQRILVDSQDVARKMRAILASEDLIPGGTDPWDLFDIERWTQTDFERNINLRRALTRQLEQHIEALDDVDSSSVTLVIPEVQVFVEDQNPTTASVVLSIKPGSDLRENKSKIEGIEKLIAFAIEGLSTEYITITDRNGIILNDFSDFGSLDRIELTRRELRLKRELEQRYINSIYNALANIYGKDRVEIINIDVAIDLGIKTRETQEFFPIETVADNPDTPFNEREYVLAIPRSTQTITESYEGSGFNPQGPAGQEGQTPPAYQDLEGLVGRYNNDETRVNNEVNARTTIEESSPQITRITAAVALDGVWRKVYSEQGRLQIGDDGIVERVYSPLDVQSLNNAEELVKAAVGFNSGRGDSVSVQHVQFDRTVEFEEEDQAARRTRLIVNSVSLGIIIFVVVLIIIVVGRMLRVALKRRKDRNTIELSRQNTAIHEAAPSSETTFDGYNFSESDIVQQIGAVVKDHPEEVAQLMRVWLVGADA